jgi:hypothetical protein
LRLSVADAGTINCAATRLNICRLYHQKSG